MKLRKWTLVRVRRQSYEIVTHLHEQGWSLCHGWVFYSGSLIVEDDDLKYWSVDTLSQSF